MTVASMQRVRAMPGRCPVPLPGNFGLSPGDFELLDWFWRVREWGVARGDFITREGIISWMSSIETDIDICSPMQETLRWLVPSD